MFIIFGLKSKPEEIGQFMRDCPQCGRKTFHKTTRVTNYFTLFFIPLIPFGKKIYFQCSVCGMSYEVKKEKQDEFLKALEEDRNTPLKIDYNLFDKKVKSMNNIEISKQFTEGFYFKDYVFVKGDKGKPESFPISHFPKCTWDEHQNGSNSADKIQALDGNNVDKKIKIPLSIPDSKDIIEMSKTGKLDDFEKNMVPFIDKLKKEIIIFDMKQVPKEAEKYLVLRKLLLSYIDLKWLKAQMGAAEYIKMMKYIEEHEKYPLEKLPKKLYKYMGVVHYTRLLGQS